MHTMKFVPEDRLWTVGYYDPQDKWVALYDCDNQMQAMKIINYLNGGSQFPDFCEHGATPLEDN